MFDKERFESLMLWAGYYWRRIALGAAVATLGVILANVWHY